MNNHIATAEAIITPEELLKYWQGHRALTRRVIDAFPETELFEFSIGGMRPFAVITKELLGIAEPGLKEILERKEVPLEEELAHLKTKKDLLQAWDEATIAIDKYFPQIQLEQFRDEVNLFGQYKNKVIQSVLYFIANEIHHRGQGYVYLRALNIEPPYFWEH